MATGDNPIVQFRQADGCTIISLEANHRRPSKGIVETMARRRFQSPTPFKEGQFWWLRIWDTNPTGSRKRQRIKIATADMPLREVQKIAEEKLRPVNQGLILTGSAMNFGDFVTTTYMPTYLPLLSTTTQNSYRGIIAKYLDSRFSRLPLRGQN